MVVVFEREPSAHVDMTLRNRPCCFTHSRQKIAGGKAWTAARLFFPSIGSALCILPEEDGPGARLKLLCLHRTIGFPQPLRTVL